MSMDLKKIYNGSFASRQRFDDGGSAYTQYDSTGNATPSNYTPGGTTTTFDQAPAAPSGGGSSTDLSPISTTQAQQQSLTNQLEAQHNINAIDSTSSAPSAASGALSSLSGAKGSSVLALISSILGAAGHMQTAKANGTLPKMPGMGGPLPSMPGQGGSTGYGPAGGYNYKNYAGLTAGAPGTGYAPRTQTAGPANYYTYGQGPEQQFFQQVNPQGGPIAPVTHKRGGSVKKFAMGGMVPNAAGPMLQGGPARPPQQPGMMGPMGAPPSPMQRPMMGAPMQNQIMGQNPGMRPGMRPFADGGSAPQEGALSHHSQGSRYVRGPGDGTSDDIPARLANGEYVLSADVVSGLGNGDNNSGAKVLDGFVHSLRTHKAENASKGKLPADAKPIHHYMKGGR
jgi:hypothetical protein